MNISACGLAPHDVTPLWCRCACKLSGPERTDRIS